MCERVPESDCLDGVDNNGDELADCEDPTCEPVVECVAGAPTGGDLGLHVTDGVCPTDFESSQLFHTGIQPQACTGCTCTTECTGTVQMWTTLDCTGTATTQTFTGIPDDSTQCKNFTATPFKSGTMTAPSISGCLAGGTATQPDPTWATDDTFCSARSSLTCSTAGQVCVAKPPAAQPLCVKVDASASCPSGYTGSDDIVYSSFVPGSCGACSTCNPATSLTCKALLFTPQVLDTANCTGAASLVDTTCGSLNRPSYTSIKMGFSHTGTDDCSPNVTSNPPVAAGAARFCCE
jgi:hypothetical protein